MEFPQTGGCLCGKIRYEISKAPRLIPLHRVSALNEQRVFDRPRLAGFRLTGDEPQPLESINDSGRVKIRWVCPVCG